MSRASNAGLHRRGFVVDRDPRTCRVRVRWPDLDGEVSAWLDVPQRKTLRDKDIWLPDIDEYVLCLMDRRHEDGYVVGALYSADDPVPSDDPDEHRITYGDGTVSAYNRRTHTLTLDVVAAGTIRLRVGRSEIEITDGRIRIQTPQFAGEQS